MAYSLDHPFGPLIEDFRFGLLAAVLVNANREKDADPVSPLDFFPWRKREETREELAARIKRDLIGM
jgi:hypothetical protein